MAKFAARGTVLGHSTVSPLDIGFPGYTPLAQVRNITGPEESRATIDVSDLQTDFAEFVAGIADAGEVTLDLVFDPADSDVTALRTALEGATSGELDYFQIVFPTPAQDSVEFAALVTKYGPVTASFDGALMASATLKVSGAPTWGVVGSGS